METHEVVHVTLDDDEAEIEELGSPKPIMPETTGNADTKPLLPRKRYLPSRILFSITALLTIPAMVLSIFVITKNNIVVPILFLAAGLMLSGYCSLRILPKSFALELDSYGFRVTRYFRSTYYPWPTIFDIRLYEFGFNKHRPGFRLSPDGRTYAYSLSATPDKLIKDVKPTELKKILEEMNVYKQHNEKYLFPYFDPERSKNPYENIELFWGRAGEGRIDVLPKLSIWEKIHNWRNP